MTRPKISFIVHDLSDNPIARAALLADALRHDYEVEVLGFLMGGDAVNEPYRNLFSYQTICCDGSLSAVLAHTPRLARMATGDIIYACKPLLPSLGPALLASGFGQRKPLFLDVEDDEWAVSCRSRTDFVWRYLVKGWRHAISWKYTLFLHCFTRCAKAVTVSSRKLQRRYGGIVVRHGSDASVFDPGRFSPDVRRPLRQRFALPADGLFLLFAGTPRTHKGLDTVVQALLRPECAGWELVLAGEREWPDFVRIAALLNQRCHRLGFVSRELMPDLLAAVDAVPVPQRRVRFTESQIPAKILDAMAMAKPVIASRVGDLPEMLGTDERGWLIEPDDAAGLASALRSIADNPVDAARRGTAAREWFLNEASATAIRLKLEPLIETALARRRR